MKEGEMSKSTHYHYSIAHIRDLRAVIRLRGMFGDCTSLTSLPQSFWNGLYSGVASGTDVDVRTMFNSCANLTGVPANKFWNWDGTDNIHLIYNKSVFNGCSALIAEGNVPSTWYGNLWDSSTNYQPVKE